VKDLKKINYFLSITIFSVVGLLTLMPAWEQSGWPANHNANINEYITQIYTSHFLSWDFLPIWTSSDLNNFGSPAPLLYHKLFYFVSGLLNLILFSPKEAVELAILFFLCVGAVGIFQYISFVGGSFFAGIIAGISLIVAKYTITDWLIRGALTEFSANMLFPWVIFFYSKSLLENKFRSGLGVFLGLSYLAHSVMAYYEIILIISSLPILWATKKINLSQLFEIKSLLKPVIWFLIFFLPVTIPLLLLTQYFDLSLYNQVYPASEQFQPIGRYFWDNLWRFGSNFAGFTVQLDFPTIALLFVSCLFYIINTKQRSRLIFTPCLLPLILITLFAFLLQLPLSAFFYNHFPGAAFLQFPWRLLGILTPLLIIISTTLIERVFITRSGTILGLYGLMMMVSAGSFAPLTYGRLGSVFYEIEQNSMVIATMYIPTIAQGKKYSPEKLSFAASERNCTIKNKPEESNVVLLEIYCQNETELPLPIYSSPFHTFSLKSISYDIDQSTCRSLKEFPGLCVINAPTGQSLVSINIPTILTMIKLLNILETKNVQ